MLVLRDSRRLLPAALAGILLFALQVGAVFSSQSCSANPAGATSPCAAVGPASQDSAAGVDTGAGNPINVTNGNKYQRETDLAALPGELGLELVRHYNSSASRVVGQLGNGWRLSYETDLYVLGRSIQILQADGARIVFSRDAGDLCSSRNPAHGRVVVRRTARGEEFTWEWPNGRKLDFNAQGRLEQIRVPSGAFLSLTRGPSGELLRVVDPARRELRFHYLDREIAHKYPQRFRGIVAIDTPVGRFKYEHGEEQRQGNLVKVDIPTHYDNSTRPHAYTERGITGSSVSRIYHYEDPDHPQHLTGITVSGSGSDRQLVNQRIATYRYDPSGRAVLSVRGDPTSGSEEVRLEYPRPGVTKLTNSLGQTTTYVHAVVAGAYRLLEARGAGCASCGEVNVRHDYDPLGNLSATTRLDLKGRAISSTTMERDARGRIVKVSRVAYRQGRAGRAKWQLRYEYPQTGGAELANETANTQPTLIIRPSVVPGKEHSLRIAYNGNGQPLSVTESGWAPAVARAEAGAIERSSRYRYTVINGRSLLTQIDAPNGNSTRIDWDGQGAFITAVTLPGNLRISVRHDDAGRIAAITDEQGRESAFNYDARSLLVATEQDGIRHSHLYDAFGNRVETGYYSSPDSYRALTHSAYDGAGRLRWRASHLGILDSWQRDSEGRVLEARRQSASQVRSARYTYDAQGRLSELDDDLGGRRRIAYDEAGRPELFTDGLGRETRYQYDGDGNSVESIATRPMTATVRFERDALQRIDKVIAPNGATTRNHRDDFGRSIEVVSPDSGETSNRYDAADRLVAATDASGNRAGYEYDAAGRIVKQEIFAAGSGTASAAPPLVTRWRYQGPHLVAIDHPGQSETYAYDNSGRLAARTVQLQLADAMMASSITRYSYDSLGQASAVSLPDGSTIAYRRNGQNQIVALERRLVRTAWLAWLLPATPIVAQIERDLTGIRRFVFGNGIEANSLRSREGVLARVVHRRAENLIDRRYRWDVAGNLLSRQDQGATSSRTESYAYDAQDRLIAAAAIQPSAATNVSRYFYDGAGNRLLSQEGIADQTDTRSGTVKTAYAERSNRRLDAVHKSSTTGLPRRCAPRKDPRGVPQGLPSLVIASEARRSMVFCAPSPEQEQMSGYDANGQPTTIAEREYLWDALGRLREIRDVREENLSIASYRYNHRGERIAKTTSKGRTHYLYEAGRLAAELDARGRITRQYLYLGDHPVALIDTPAGRALEHERSLLWQIAADLVTICQAWFYGDESIVYLHNNHLGAPELATDVQGHAVWSAVYAPFGRIIRTGATNHSRFKLNLRLPGQYEDEESGLHYNGQRYYDPDRGNYLSPDPLGLRAGLNAYSYAANNPLKYIDPEGLILFAFDGTDNSNPPPGADDFSNVYKFYLAYDAAQNGPKWYMNGVGRDDPDSQINTNWLDEANANTARARVNYMLQQLDQYMQGGSVQKGDWVNIDVIGFSRGAAMARDFTNSVATRLSNQTYQASGACLQIRFLGLWDTVAQFGLNGADNASWQLAIPSAARNVFQAVALNEHRYLFPGEAIGSGTQRGFIGSHADIGGSYGTGDLSDVALNWIVDQAKISGVKMNAWSASSVGHPEWATVTDPVLHDKSNGSGDRNFCLRANNKAWTISCQKQRQATPGGMNWSQTASYIDLYAQATMDADGSSKIVGAVNMEEYGKWLKQYYGFDILSAAP